VGTNQFVGAGKHTIFDMIQISDEQHAISSLRLQCGKLAKAEMGLEIIRGPLDNTQSLNFTDSINLKDLGDNGKVIGQIKNNGIDISGTYKINGTPLASSNLSDSSNIAKLDASNEFRGALEADSVQVSGALEADSVQVSGALGVGSPTDANPFEVTQVESTTVWEELVLGPDFEHHKTDRAEYSITTFTKLGVGGAANTTFKRVDFRGIAKFTSANDVTGSIVFNFDDQTPPLPTTSRRHVCKILYYVPKNTNTNSSSEINMPTTLFYRDIGDGVYAARAGQFGAVVGMDPTVTAGTKSNQILDLGYGTINSELVIDNTFYYSKVIG